MRFLLSCLLIIFLFGLTPRNSYAALAPNQAAAYNNCMTDGVYALAVQRFGSANCILRTDIGPPEISGYQYWIVYPSSHYFCSRPLDECMFGQLPRPAPPPGRTNGPPPDCNCIGDPIDAGTGNAYLLAEDLTAGRWLKFDRHYNSDVSAGSGTLGQHWSHTYSRTIAYTPSGSSPYALANVTREDGRVSTFQLQNGTWVSEQDVYDLLTAQLDGAGNPLGWTLVRADTHSTEYFDASGHLISINSQNGDVVTLTYSTAATPTSVAPGPGYLISINDPSQRAIHLAYDANGRVNLVTSPDGSSYIYAYDSSNNLVSVTYPDGKSLNYLYDEPSRNGGATVTGLLTGIMDENGARFDSYSYNASGKAVKNELAGGVGSFSLTYNSDGTADVLDPLGVSRHRIFSSGGGTPVTSSLSGPCQTCSKTASATYDFNNELVQTKDFNGNISTYKHDGNGLETELVEGSSSSAKRTIQTDWNVTFRVPLERRLFDASGTLLSKKDWIYNGRGQPLVQCDIDPVQASSYTCSATGIPPAGVRRFTYTYCDAIDSSQCPLVGLLLSVTGPRTDLISATHYSYYLATDESGCGTFGGACHRAGDLYQTIDAAGHVNTFVSYDKNGRVTRQRDANGVLTDFAYHPRGWLLTSTIRANADGTPSQGDAVTQIGYTSYGAVSSTIDPDGVQDIYSYDAAHRLTDMADAMGNRIHYTLDAAGNKIKEEIFNANNVLSRSLTRSYNALGQLASITDGLNRTVFNASFSDSYDPNGNLVRSADALGTQRKHGYDALNRLINTLDNYNGTDSATQNTQRVLAYDARDKLLGISDPDGLNTTYDYDGLGNITAAHSPDTGTSTYAYDAAGNRIQDKDAKAIVSNSTYDALDRLLATSYPDSSANISYRYDEPDSITGCTGSHPIGRMTSLVETAVTTTYCYDARGNVVQKRQTQGVNVDTVAYTFTLADRLSSVRTPNNLLIQYGRDAAGRVNAVTELPSGGSATANVVTNVSYLPLGPIASYTLGNGQTVTRTYDINYALTDIVSPALNLHFARDAMGNVTAFGNSPGANPAVETYSYDPLYRLTGLKDAQGQAIETYTYNRTGDRLSKVANGLATGAYSYQSGTHLLTSIGSTARTYDFNGNTTGNTTGSETFGYGYNDRNRMIVAQRNGQTVASYTYNALEQRIAKMAILPQAIEQRFAYDEDGLLLGEYGTTNRSYVWLGSLPVALVDASGSSSTVSYVHADGMNTPRAITDGQGSIVWQWPYQGNPFGEKSATSAGTAFNLRFPGQYYDAETGLNYNVNRDYDSLTGRYLQPDPTGLDGGINLFAYTGDDPLNYVDPDGLLPVPGGPWHPPKGVSSGCVRSDSCRVIEGKMALLMRMLHSHQWWDWKNPPPRGGSTHADEIADLWRAFAYCQALHERKCKQCPPAPKPNCTNPIECATH